MTIRNEWVGEGEIKGLLDVTTAACTGCGNAARVPEDVVAVLDYEGRKVPYVICPACTPAFIEGMDSAVREALADAGVEPEEDSEEEEPGEWMGGAFTIRHRIAYLILAAVLLALAVWSFTEMVIVEERRGEFALAGACSLVAFAVVRRGFVRTI